eukprot:11479880-Alexandrium_andersonii.AAC.1
MAEGSSEGAADPPARGRGRAAGSGSPGVTRSPAGAEGSLAPPGGEDATAGDARPLQGVGRPPERGAGGP